MKTIQCLTIYFALIASAISQQYSGSNSGLFGTVGVLSTLGQLSFYNIPITTMTDLNLTPSSLQYNSYSFSSATSPSLSVSATRPVDGTFLQYRTITATITLHPFGETLENLGPRQIQYAGGNSYLISGGGTGFTSVSIPGAYEISGPNETVTGTFNLQLSPFDGGVAWPHQRVDVTGYPLSVEMTSGHDSPLFSGGSDNIFSGVVDGVSLTIRGNTFYMNSSELLQQVPEPASTFLLLLGLPFAWLVARHPRVQRVKRLFS